MLPPARNHVITFVDFIKQRFYVFGIILHITVHRHNDLTYGMVETSGHSCCLTKVAAHAHCFELRGLLGYLTNDFKRVIDTSIIDQDNFVTRLKTRKDVSQLLTQFVKVFCFIVIMKGDEVALVKYDSI